jgi:hypothetical protein
MPTHKKPNTEEIWRFFLFSTSGDGNSPKSRHFHKKIISLFGEISPGKTEKLQEGGVAC